MRTLIMITTAAIALMSATPVLAASKADITQAGMGHTLSVTQNGGVAGSVSISQAGTHNALKISQTDDGSTGGYRNIAVIDQSGQDNQINSGFSNGLLSLTGQEHISPDRGANAAIIKQNGHDNVIGFHQASFENSLKINQGLTSGREAPDHHNVVLASQDGQINDATIIQSGNFNRSTSFQESNLGKVSVTQSGSNNTQYIAQFASQTSFKINQSGLDNSASVAQFGNSDSVEINQSGEGNGLTVNQDIPFASAKLGQSGDHSQITLMQKSNSAQANIVQTASASSITLVQ